MRSEILMQENLERYAINKPANQWNKASNPCFLPICIGVAGFFERRGALLKSFGAYIFKEPELVEQGYKSSLDLDFNFQKRQFEI